MVTEMAEDPKKLKKLFRRRHKEEAAGTRRRYLVKTLGICAAIAALTGAVSLVSARTSKTAAKKELTASLANIVTPNDWTLGGDAAPETLVLYCSFESEPCAQTDALVGEFISANQEFKTALRHFVPAKNQAAEAAARAAEAAGLQERFFEMRDVLFARQNEWAGATGTRPLFAQYAADINLDADRFLNDLNTPEVTEKIRRDTETAVKAGVEKSPSLFLGRVKLETPKTIEELKRAIEEARALVPKK